MSLYDRLFVETGLNAIPAHEFASAFKAYAQGWPEATQSGIETGFDIVDPSEITELETMLGHIDNAIDDEAARNVVNTFHYAVMLGTHPKFVNQITAGELNSRLRDASDGTTRR